MSLLSKLKNPKAAFARLAEKYINYHHNFSYNFYKNGESELLRKFGETNPQVVFDVGANIGEWSKIASVEFQRAEIHCFELSSTTFRILKRNISSDRVILHNFGLSSSEGSVKYKD